MKLFQYDKKVWTDNLATYTWQFGIFKNRSLLWVQYEDYVPTNHRGLHVSFSFFANSLFEVEIQVGKVYFSFNTLSPYFCNGWEE